MGAPVRPGSECGKTNIPTLNSSAIRRAEYSPTTRVLTIWFVDSGGPCDYYGVLESVYRGLLSASSAGSYFSCCIRDRYSSNR
uniref:KTSC domain-containing protein n=1 Tax=Ancylobacter mangrovi TaxID=2972472 RepID=UPI0035A890AF